MDEIKTLAGVSDAAVKKATGKGWQEWLALLDNAGAAGMAHKDIALYLYEKQGVPDWWCQMLTVGYEQARGRREKHQMGDSYEVSRSKTIDVSLAKLYAAWADEALRKAWLPGKKVEIRKATPRKSMRITWAGGPTGVNVAFTAKGPRKSSVTVQHIKLAGAEEAERMKGFWAEALERLKKKLEG